jgi:hypothetical protein
MRRRRIRFVVGVAVPIVSALVGLVTNLVSANKHWPSFLDFLSAHPWQSLGVLLTVLSGITAWAALPAKVPHKIDLLRAADGLATAVHRDWWYEADWRNLAARTADYRSVVRPAVGAEVRPGIELCPLRASEVADYLRESAGGSAGAARWEPVIAAFTAGRSPPVALALTTPLMAALARAVYNPRLGEDLSAIPLRPSPAVGSCSGRRRSTPCRAPSPTVSTGTRSARWPHGSGLQRRAASGNGTHRAENRRGSGARCADPDLVACRRLR